MAKNDEARSDAQPTTTECTDDATHNLLCDYDAGPCVAMSRHSRRETDCAPRGGVVQLDNRVNVAKGLRLYHMGFALRGVGVSAPTKAGVMLNFCPWCGADLSVWLERFRADIASEREGASS